MWTGEAQAGLTAIVRCLFIRVVRSIYMDSRLLRDQRVVQFGV